MQKMTPQYFEERGMNPLLMGGEVGDVAACIHDVMHFLSGAVINHDSLNDKAAKDGLFRILWMVEEAAEVVAERLNTPGATPSYQDASKALLNLAAANGHDQQGREAIGGVLAKFGAAKLPEVAPEQFADLIAECEALQAA